MSFLWYRDIPIWVAACGTAAIALIALVTLRPVIENLELRDRNLELAEDSRGLQERIKTTQATQRELNVDLRILNRQRDAASEEIKHLRQRQDSLLNTLTLISDNISKQAAREGDLRTRLDQLEDEGRQLRTKRDQLEARNSQLQRERAEIQHKLTRAEKEFERVDQELKNTYRLNRRFILEQIQTKVTDSVPIRGEGKYTDYLIEIRRALGIWSWVLPGPHVEGGKAGMVWGASGSRVPKNGKQLIAAQFGSQMFKLLPEAEQPRFQDAIRNFMDKNKEVFSANLDPDFALDERLWYSQRLVKTTKGSKYFDESTPEPVKVAKGEVKARELAYEEAKSAVEKDIARMHAARIALHEAMDHMVVQLTGSD